MIEHAPMPRFVRRMREHAVFAHVGRERIGNQQRRGRDEAVDQNRHARFGGGEIRARHHRDFEAAEGGEHVERCRVDTGR